MTTLLESPAPAIAIGGFLAVCALVVFLSRRTLGPLVALALVLALTGGMLVVERVVLTDREEVEAAVAGVLAAVEANDVEGVVRWIDPQDEAIVRDARALMPIVNVERARAMGGVAVDVQPGASTAQAQSKFRAMFNGTSREGGAPIGYFDDVEISWERREGGGWLIIGYTVYYKGQPIDAVSSARSNRPVP